jgi:hypothetical protein
MIAAGSAQAGVGVCETPESDGSRPGEPPGRGAMTVFVDAERT